MLSRAFRLTDKLSGAGLRIAGWALAGLAGQLFIWRVTLIDTVLGLFTSLTRTARSGQAVYRATEERRRTQMARRASIAEERPLMREDPLKTQNRALSLFTVVLLCALIVFVLWFTTATPISGNVPPPGLLPTLRLSPTSLPAGALVPPTDIPTITPVTDPLQVGGSIVYAMHQHGYDNLWTVGIGQSAPIRLTNDPADDRDPAWSHDGTQIAFASHRDGNWELYVMTAATGAIRRLTFTPGYEAHPTWSSDDKYIAYEAYANNNLDVWIVSADGKQAPQQLTQNPAPDFAPAWSPNGGRDIAYVSLRDGSPQIYVLNLDHLGNPQDSTALRITNTSGVECDSPAWSPDGREIAYTGRDQKGLQLIYAVSLAQPDAAPIVVGPGRDPAWSPNGRSILASVDNGSSSTLIAYQVGSVGVASTAIALEGHSGRVAWSASTLPQSLVQHPPPSTPVAPPLYAPLTATPSGYDNLAVVLADVPDAVLNERVADSFLKLRDAVRIRTGLDFLGSNISLWWAIQGANRHLPDPGQSLQNWHYAGRAFDFDRNLVYAADTSSAAPPVEVVREDSIDGQTYWRVYIRVAEPYQGGHLREPLKRLPWDMSSRSSGDPQAYENGGRLETAVPSGYYVDFTALAEDYGWERLPSDRDWRALFSALLYWEFDQRDNLSWDDAMKQLYPPDQIAAFLSGPTPVPTPKETATLVLTRTPTPIPPDQQTH